MKTDPPTPAPLINLIANERAATGLSYVLVTAMLTCATVPRVLTFNPDVTLVLDCNSPAPAATNGTGVDKPSSTGADVSATLDCENP